MSKQYEAVNPSGGYSGGYSGKADKTTEQPIPSDFQKWAEDNFGMLGLNAKTIAIYAAYRDYRHLHSLPPSPVGEAGDEENPTTIERAMLFAQGMVDHSPKDRQYWKGHLDALVFAKEWLDESPNPSRAGETGKRYDSVFVGNDLPQSETEYLLCKNGIEHPLAGLTRIDNALVTTASEFERAGEISPVEKIATITKQRDNLRMALAELMADVRNMPKEIQRTVNHDMLKASEAIAMCSPPPQNQLRTPQ